VIGLIGFGSVGKEVARRLQNWHSILLAYDPFVDHHHSLSFGVRLVPLCELIRRSDFVSVHVPSSAETKRMVNTDLLRQMKPGAFLINTTRGDVVDEAALLNALDSGQLGGAALDVYAEEPPAANSRLRQHQRLIATPHCGAHTDGAADGMGWQSLRDCIAVLRGETPMHPVRIPGAAV